MNIGPRLKFIYILLFVGIAILINGCRQKVGVDAPIIAWYVFNEPSDAFLESAQICTQAAKGRYTVKFTPLPTDADQQREQLVRRLASGDSAIDIIGMDVIWTAEFAEAGWILPLPEQTANRVSEGRLISALASTRYYNRLWAIPFTANAQLLWYRKDRITALPETWNDLIQQAEASGIGDAIELQGQRYEGMTVFFLSLLASAGGSVLDDTNTAVSLAEQPTKAALSLMKRLGNSKSIDKGLDTAREDQARLAFETGNPRFMVNYSFVWPSAQANAPEVAANMAFARWPRVYADKPSRVTVGGLNLAVGAFTKFPNYAFEAAECLASAPSQLRAAKKGGLPPTLEHLYQANEIRSRFPFAEVLHETLKDAVLRPQTPVYNDISLAIGRTLHPMRNINPERDLRKLRQAVSRALNSEGLM